MCVCVCVGGGGGVLRQAMGVGFRRLDERDFKSRCGGEYSEGVLRWW